MTTRDKNPEPESDKPASVSRRGFLKGVGLVAAAATVPVVATACDVPEITPAAPSEPIPVSLAEMYPEVPIAPATPPDATRLKVLSPHEARTVDALTSRLLPGTPEDPGAHEAGVVTFIDNVLAHQQGIVDKAYREAPFAEIYEGEPPTSTDGYQQVWVSAEEIERYGVQSLLTPREVYRFGLLAVDRYARERFQGRFIDLSEDEQDQIIEAMASGEATGFEPFASTAFFQVLRRHTAEGMFSDPAYGGNRGMVGWSLIGYPGAQRAYTPEEMRTEAPPRPPQSLAQLSHFHPGEYAGPNVVLPVSGSNEEFPVHHEHP